MKQKIFLMLLIASLIGLVGCADEELATLEGTWQGTKAKGEVVKFGVPTGFDETDDNFQSVIEFMPGGSVTLTQDGASSQGTWSQTGDQLTTSINFKTEFIDLSGTYTIQTSTATKLVLYFEKDGSYQDPDTGINIDGTLRVSLYFDKK